MDRHILDIIRHYSDDQRLLKDVHVQTSTSYIYFIKPHLSLLFTISQSFKPHTQTYTTTSASNSSF